MLAYNPAPVATIAGKKPKLDHVACGVPSIETAAHLVEGTLRGRPYRGGPSPEFRGAQWTFDGGGVLELIEPAGGEDGFLRRFLRSRGPGIHHVTFKVADIHAARRHAQSLGYQVIGFNDATPSWKECFLHPREAMGLVVQMAEVAAESDTWLPLAPFLADNPAGPAAALLGLRLAAANLEEAVRLWRDVCCASSVERERGSAVFAWEDCPLTIRVIETTDFAEGPLGLEVLLPEGVRLQENPPASIGANLILEPAPRSRRG